MSKHIVRILGFFVIAATMVLAGCSGDEYDQMTRPISGDGTTQAKDRNAEEKCNEIDLKIYDCFDACQCCYDLAQEDPENHDTLDQCVWYCDGLLLKINDIENQSKADIDNYKECVVGCFSICEKTDKDVVCYEECKHYLD